MGEEQINGIPVNGVLKIQNQALAYDPMTSNVMYCKGQAHGEMETLQVAAADSSKPTNVCANNEAVAQVLSEARESLEQKEERIFHRDGVIIEEITGEELHDLSLESETDEPGSVVNFHVENVNAGLQVSQDGSYFHANGLQTSCLVDELEYCQTLEALSQNPGFIRNMQNFMNNVDLESMEFVSGEKMTPDMVKMVPDIDTHMPPEGLQKTIEMTSAFPGKSQALAPTSKDTNSRQPSHTGMHFSAPTSEESGILSSKFSAMPSLSSDMEEHMRKQMENPAMIQMFSEMIKSVSPEMIASISEQFGVELSSDAALQAQKTMSTFRLDDLNRMIHSVERVERIADHLQKLKKWMSERMGLIFTLLILLLAIILHKLGYIGN